jgi:hypothetical protein
VRASHRYSKRKKAEKAARKESEAKARTKKIQDAISSVPNFESIQNFTTEAENSFIALDEEQRKLAIGHQGAKEQEFTHTVINAREIMSAELIENGVTISQFSAPAKVAGGAAIGSAFGEAGAIVGALARSSSSKDEIDGVHLKIWLDNVFKPYETFTFSDNALQANSRRHKEVSAVAEQWLGIVRILINRESKERAGENIDNLQ